MHVSIISSLARTGSSTSFSSLASICDWILAISYDLGTVLSFKSNMRSWPNGKGTQLLIKGLRVQVQSDVPNCVVPISEITPLITSKVIRLWYVLLTGNPGMLFG